MTKPINEYPLTEGYTLSNSGGDDVISNANASVSDFIVVLPNTTVTVTGYVMQRINVYDANKNRIFSSNNWISDVSIPSNGHYIRFAQERDYISRTTIILETVEEHLYNIVPSASDGSLIFSMYAPSNTVQPASGVWDLKGLEFDNYHTFGLNNDIIQAEDGSITMPNRLDGYSYAIDNLRLLNEIANYTASDANTFPAFNAEFKYSYIVNEQDGSYAYRILADDMDNLPTVISFRNKTSLLTIEYLNTSKVTTMDSMFYGCTSLTSLDVSNWNTSKVTTMAGMFQNCSNLTSLDVSNWNTSNVTNMSAMFLGCKTLTSLDVSNFDTKNVTTMGWMFQNCSNLTSLDLSNFNTSKVTTMAGIFYNCIRLTSLDSMQNIPVSLSLSSTKLDQTSLVDVINNLKTVTTTQTLTLGATLLAKLTEEQIAVAVNKGWTVN